MTVEEETTKETSEETPSTPEETTDAPSPSITASSDVVAEQSTPSEPESDTTTNNTTTENKGSNLLQLIDDDSNFYPKLPLLLDEWNITNRGFDYHIVAILGCQSSGKSTLLNLLFGTGFQVMNSDLGRTQTTVGIWLGKADNQDTLVLDVEGTDSRERGEDAANYERKTALFSLALAEILIVNLWHTDIGRYNAANYSLLKNVFELNLQLFARSRKGKTLMLFVIRDHVATPLDKLEALIRQDMVKIWGQLQKPNELAEAQIEEFFDFAFKALPHKEFQPENFVTEVGHLKERFNNPSTPNYLWKSNYTTDIPADGWAAYANSVWETIKSNKDLDLPTQKEMLAMYRCDEIIEQALQAFNVKLEPLRRELSKNSSRTFGQTAEELLNSTLAFYDGPASRYHKDVAARKRDSLKGIVLRDLHDLFLAQISRLREQALASFDSKLESSVPSESTKSVPEFGEIVDRLERNTIEDFEAQAKNSFVPNVSDWSYEPELQQLRDAISSRINLARQKQLELLVKEMTDYLNMAIAPINKLFDAAAPGTWSKIRELYENVKSNAKTELVTRLTKFKLSEAEVKKYEKKLDNQVFDTLRDAINFKVKNINNLLDKRFDEAFRLDSKGLPRHWEEKDDIPTLCEQARKKTIALLDLYCILRLEKQLDDVHLADLESGSAKVDSSLILINPNLAEEITDRFNKQSEVAYFQAIRAQEQAASKKNTPIILILIILLLGFNEFMYVASTLIYNPFLLCFILILGGGIYISYSLGLLSLLAPLKDPIVSILKSTGASAAQATLNQVMSKIKGQPEERPKRD
eukprot:TRINITY_DN461_c0_g1_i1.p1 TRINITY_DN461_c0_g1~~TRINITY_DN461_c0_g1_i1.p1  ORF type:complete len:809 (-),score=280.41 TRINITY_DN461_c0_g1_i1:132-2558(-)